MHASRSIFWTIPSVGFGRGQRNRPNGLDYLSYYNLHPIRMLCSAPTADRDFYRVTEHHYGPSDRWTPLRNFPLSLHPWGGQDVTSSSASLLACPPPIRRRSFQRRKNRKSCFNFSRNSIAPIRFPCRLLPTISRVWVRVRVRVFVDLLLLLSSSPLAKD